MKNFRHIANLIKGKRTNAINLSQQKLSDRLGFKNGQFISNVERAKCSIPLESLPEICSILGITKEEITEALLNDYKDDITNVLTTKGA